MLDYAKIQPIYLNIFSAFLLNIEMNANITTKTGFFLLSSHFSSGSHFQHRAIHSIKNFNWLY